MLRTNDIVQLNLNADLVVLSAFRTGMGQMIKGEGIVSLAHSFFSAGAKRLITSSWNVEDKVTALTMKNFYENLLVKGELPSIALRNAQLEILKDKRWRNPYYWSAFALQGID